jgi:uncharacterized protein (TIGR02466 family)
MVKSIFPIPLGIYDLEKSLNKSEHKYFSDLKLRKNTGNYASIDTHILENKKMNRLKKFFLESLKDYSLLTYNFKNDVELYITQSWLNLSEPKDYHHRHRHPNSILSGVFYINVDDEKDRIYFYQDSADSIYRGNVFSFEEKDFNDFNSASWWMPSITGRLYIFPSGLQHDVPFNNDRIKNRTSLSFNTFVKGNIGVDRVLTGLKL